MNNRKIDTHLIKHIASMVFWYVLGFITLVLITEGILPINRDFGNCMGILVDIMIFLIILADLMEINKPSKRKKGRRYKKIMKYWE